MRKRKGALVLLLAILLAVLLCLDQRILVTDSYTVAVRDLPESFEGYRIVQLSDLHGAEFGENNAGLVEKVAEQQPDLIVLTGDFVCEEGDEKSFAALLPQLRAIAPCYFVSGNHEWSSHMMRETERILEENDTVYLNNRYVFLERDGQKLCLCGAEDLNGYADMLKPAELMEQLHDREGDIPVILLYHRNTLPEKLPELDVDLILCGHSHGGIIRLPFIGGILGTDRKPFPVYDAGVFELENYTMVVSRGLGNIHHIPRILNFPEIVVVELEKAA